MDVCLHAADRIISLDQAPAGGLLQNVEHLLTVAEPIEKGRQGPHIHAEAGKEQQVRVDTLQLVHDRADVLHALGHLHPQPLLDTPAERMAVLRRPEVVEAVGKRQRLGVGQAFAHLLDAAVDVTAMHVELADDLAFERHAETQHAVRGGVLRADVDDIFVLLEQDVAVADEAAVRRQFKARGAVLRHFVGHAQRVEPRVVILTQGVPHPVVAQEQAPHVGMVQETDAEIVEDFALVEFRSLPQVADRRKPALLAAGGQRPQHDVLARRGGFEVVDRPEPLFAPVHARQAAQEIESLGPQACSQGVEFLHRDGEHPVPGLRPHGAGFPGRYFFVDIHCFSPPSTFKSFFSAVRSRRSSSSYSCLPICLFTPPKNRCNFTLRCNCISP